MSNGGQASPDGLAMKRAAEIMIPLDHYPAVRTTDTLRHAIAVMEEARLEVGRRRSLPRVLLVFDSDQELVGIVRRRDIMRGLEPDFLVDQALGRGVRAFDIHADPHLAELSFDRLVKGVRERSKRPVSEVMRPVSATLGPNELMTKAIYEMVSLNQSLIPVVEGEEVLGVVRSVDVLHELAQLIL